MIFLRGGIHWTSATAFLFLNLMMLDSCIIFETIKYVAMDTSTCLLQNFTEPVTEWVCLKSCHKNATVSIIKKAVW